MSLPAFSLEPLESRRLLSGSAALDLFNILQVSLDQPRINAMVSRTPTGDPLLADIFGTQFFNIQAYYDTGASGILLSNDTADLLGITRDTFGGEPIVFADVGVAGSSYFNVSEQLYLRLAKFADSADVDNLATFNEVYTQTFGPVRTQVGPVPPPEDPMLANLDVIGMPAMTGKVVVMDARPVLGVEQFELLGTMKTYVYDPGTPFDAANDQTEPGIPQVHYRVPLSYVSFDRFTQVTPAGAPGPTLANNPFVGPNPFATSAPLGDAETPPVVITANSQNTSGSYLLDTGASLSFISLEQAGALGVTYVPETFGTDNPILQGTTSPQFKQTIGGVGGTTTLAGFYLDTLTLPTVEGTNMVFHDVPVLVGDITLQDPVTLEPYTIEGILGMNLFVSTADFIPTFPFFLGLADGNFNWIVFDDINRTLGLNLVAAEGAEFLGPWRLDEFSQVGNQTPLPEPSAALGLIGLVMLAAQRRRASRASPAME